MYNRAGKASSSRLVRNGVAMASGGARRNVNRTRFYRYFGSNEIHYFVPLLTYVSLSVLAWANELLAPG